MVKFDISTISSHLAIVFNAFLIWLIWKKSGNVLSDYRKILYLGAIFDFLFSIITVFCESLIIFTTEYYFIVIEGWISYLGNPYAFLVAVFHVYFSYASISVATVQFIYRFFLIFWDITLNTKAFIALVIASFLSAAYMGVTWFIFFYPKVDQLEIYGPILLSTGQVKNDHLKSFIVAQMNGSKATSIFTIIQSSICFGIMIICSLGIIFRLWKHRKNFSLADQKMHNQITVVLMCEALVPLVTMIIPLGFLSFLRRLLPWFPSVLTYIIAFSPIFNPIVKIFVISPFRKTVFGIISNNSKTQTSVTVVFTNLK